MWDINPLKSRSFYQCRELQYLIVSAVYTTNRKLLLHDMKTYPDAAFFIHHNLKALCDQRTELYVHEGGQNCEMTWSCRGNCESPTESGTGVLMLVMIKAVHTYFWVQTQKDSRASLDLSFWKWRVILLRLFFLLSKSKLGQFLTTTWRQRSVMYLVLKICWH